MSGAVVVTGDDDMLWNGREEDGNVSECEGDEGTDCGGEDSNTDWYRWIECDVLCVLIV